MDAFRKGLEIHINKILPSERRKAMRNSEVS